RDAGDRRDPGDDRRGRVGAAEHPGRCGWGDAMSRLTTPSGLRDTRFGEPGYPKDAGSSTGFQIAERLLKEAQYTGRSATVQQWTASARQRLTLARRATDDARAHAQIDRIQRAYEAAAALIPSLQAQR